METFIKEKIGDGNFSDLQIPFAVIACDITNGERVVLHDDPLAPALRASAAIPGLFSPVEIGGKLLVDGGIVDNLPVGQVRNMGAKYMIACDVSKRGKLNRPPSNPFEIVLQMIYIMQNRSALAECDTCDCYIRPEVSQYSSWGFSDAQKVLEAGQLAGEAAIIQLKQDLLT